MKKRDIKFNEIYHGENEEGFITLMFVNNNSDKCLYFDGYDFCIKYCNFVDMKLLNDFNTNMVELEVVKIVMHIGDIEPYFLFSDSSIVHICSGPIGYGEEIVYFIHVYGEEEKRMISPSGRSYYDTVFEYINKYEDYEFDFE